MFWKNIRLISLALILGLGFGFYAGKKDNETEYTKKEQNREKEETKIVEKIIERPGKEKIIYRTIRERTDKRTKKQTEIVTKSPDWLVGVSADSDAILGRGGSYTISLDRKVLGDLYMGVYGSTDNQVGLSLRYSF
jgi:hypothetical protein